MIRTSLTILTLSLLLSLSPGLPALAGTNNQDDTGPIKQRLTCEEWLDLPIFRKIYIPPPPACTVADDPEPHDDDQSPDSASVSSTASPESAVSSDSPSRSSSSSTIDLT